MCGRVIQASGPLSLAIVDGLDVRDSRLSNMPRRYNAAPSQELLVIRQNPKTGGRSLDFLKWGLIPYWCGDPKGGRRLLRVEGDQGAKGQAAIRRCDEGRLPVRHRRAVGELEGSCKGRMGQDV